ncbi:hypothetical protein ABEF95_006700 [Exophiala dermatitidis]
MATPRSSGPPVVLFGYDSSPFTQKVRLSLKLKQIPYTFVIVPSMMPRPILRDNFGITYRKIPVLVIGRDIYIDTSLILEVLEHQFPASKGYGTLYPPPSPSPSSSVAAEATGSNNASSNSSSSPYNRHRPLIRGFASYWTDKPLFRITTGLIPSSVWRSKFGTDRANLIGHNLDAEKLERKVPENLSALDLHLSLLEPLFYGVTSTTGGPWIFDGETPSAADIALYYQLDWGEKISRGEGVADLSGGEVEDGPKTVSSGKEGGVGEVGVASVFNEQRYPGLSAWFARVRMFFDGLPSTETRVEKWDHSKIQQVLEEIKAWPLEDGHGGGSGEIRVGRQESGVGERTSTGATADIPLLPTPAGSHVLLDKRNGLVPGVIVSVAPDDTGRSSPSIGTLLVITPEEVVIIPKEEEKPQGFVSGSAGGACIGQFRVHFPRLGFVVRPVDGGHGARL